MRHLGYSCLIIPHVGVPDAYVKNVTVLGAIVSDFVHERVIECKDLPLTPAALQPGNLYGRAIRHLQPQMECQPIVLGPSVQPDRTVVHG